VFVALFPIIHKLPSLYPNKSNPLYLTRSFPCVNLATTALDVPAAISNLKLGFVNPIPTFPPLAI
jgi:hypothetical protein